MRKTTGFAITITCLLYLALFCLPCSADSVFVEPIGEYGYIDWMAQRVYATGIGIFPQNASNRIQAKAMAQRAALVVAQRNLLGVIKGVHIDSKTVVENRIAQDDTVIAKIEGVVKFCKVENMRMIDDRSVEVFVSMPITGKLGEILIRAIEGGPAASGLPPSADIEQRLEGLENRILLLEEQIAALRKVSVQKEDLIHLFKQLNLAVQACVNSSNFAVSKAGYASDAETAAIRDMLNDQEKRLASLAVHMNDLASRLSALESRASRSEPPAETLPEAKAYPYTGLIVDARHTNFKPCLKPYLFMNGAVVYPTETMDLNATINGGYVRYYADTKQAQQSDRVGSLPYRVVATGTYEGDRGLSISQDAASVLNAVLQTPNNFLSRAAVVIIIGAASN